MDGIPQGMQDLLLMASEDQRLREALLHDREATLGRCGVILTDNERSVLLSVPADRLAQMIERMGVTQPERREFLRVGAAAVVALLTGGAVLATTRGIQADAPGRINGISRGTCPDVPGPSPRPSARPTPCPSTSPSSAPPTGRRPAKPSPRPSGQPPPPTGTGHRPDIP